MSPVPGSPWYGGTKGAEKGGELCAETLQFQSTATCVGLLCTLQKELKKFLSDPNTVKGFDTQPLLYRWETEAAESDLLPRGNWLWSTNWTLVNYSWKIRQNFTNTGFVREGKVLLD